jgi:hypothetical protein
MWGILTCKQQKTTQPLGLAGQQLYIVGEGGGTVDGAEGELGLIGKGGNEIKIVVMCKKQYFLCLPFIQSTIFVRFQGK